MIVYVVTGHCGLHEPPTKKKNAGVPSLIWWKTIVSLCVSHDVAEIVFISNCSGHNILNKTVSFYWTTCGHIIVWIWKSVHKCYINVRQMWDRKESLTDDFVTFLGSVCNWISHLLEGVEIFLNVLLHTILSFPSLLCLEFIFPHQHFLTSYWDKSEHDVWALSLPPMAFWLLVN